MMDDEDKDLESVLIMSENKFDEVPGNSIPLIQFLLPSEEFKEVEAADSNDFSEETLQVDNAVYDFTSEFIKIKVESNTDCSNKHWKELCQKMDSALDEIFTDVSRMAKQDLEAHPTAESKLNDPLVQNETETVVPFSQSSPVGREQHLKQSLEGKNYKDSKSLYANSRKRERRKSETETKNCAQYSQTNPLSPSKTKVSQQRRLDNSESKRFKCSRLNCNFTSNFKSSVGRHELLIHIKRKTNGTSKSNRDINSKKEKAELQSKKFKCSECEFVTNWNRSLKTHESLFHKKGRAKSNCDTKVKKRETKLKPKSFRCLKCDFVTKWNKSLKKHELLHVGGRTDEREALSQSFQSENKIFKCLECDYVCTLRKNLKYHEAKHSETKDFKCFKCDFESKFRSSLRRHELIHYKIEALRAKARKAKKLSQLKRGTSKCSKCDFVTKLRRNLKIHEMRHLNSETVQHSETKDGNLVKQKLSDSQHNNSVKQESSSLQRGNFKCLECNFVAKYKSSLKEHEIIHLKVENVKYSDVNSNSSKNFNDHFKTKIFKCSKCYYASTFKSDVNKHEKEHLKTQNIKNSRSCHKKKTVNTETSVSSSDSKCFKCLHCAYEGKNNVALTAHKLIHLTVKKLKCSQCNYATNLMRNLRQHNWIHLKVKRLKCSYCDYRTNYNNRIKKHELSHSKT